MATTMDVTTAEGILAYPFENQRHAQIALRAPGASVEGAEQLPDGNRGLALLGDSVIKTVILDHGYNAGEERSE